MSDDKQERHPSSMFDIDDSSGSDSRSWVSRAPAVTVIAGFAGGALVLFQLGQRVYRLVTDGLSLSIGDELGLANLLGQVVGACWVLLAAGGMCLGAAGLLYARVGGRMVLTVGAILTALEAAAKSITPYVYPIIFYVDPGDLGVVVPSPLWSGSIPAGLCAVVALVSAYVGSAQDGARLPEPRPSVFLAGSGLSVVGVLVAGTIMAATEGNDTRLPSVPVSPPQSLPSRKTWQTYTGKKLAGPVEIRLIKSVTDLPPDACTRKNGLPGTDPRYSSPGEGADICYKLAKGGLSITQFALVQWIPVSSSISDLGQTRDIAVTVRDVDKDEFSDLANKIMGRRYPQNQIAIVVNTKVLVEIDEPNVEPSKGRFVIRRVLAQNVNWLAATFHG